MGTQFALLVSAPGKWPKLWQNTTTINHLERLREKPEIVEPEYFALLKAKYSYAPFSDQVLNEHLYIKIFNTPI